MKTSKRPQVSQFHVCFTDQMKSEINLVPPDWLFIANWKYTMQQSAHLTATMENMHVPVDIKCGGS